MDISSLNNPPPKITQYWGMKTGSKVTISWGTNYTVPQDGFIVYHARYDDSRVSVYLNNVRLLSIKANVICESGAELEVRKGDVFKISGGNDGTASDGVPYREAFFFPANTKA